MSPTFCIMEDNDPSLLWLSLFWVYKRCAHNIVCVGVITKPSWDEACCTLIGHQLMCMQNYKIIFLFKPNRWHLWMGCTSDHKYICSLADSFRSATSSINAQWTNLQMYAGQCTNLQMYAGQWRVASALPAHPHRQSHSCHHHWPMKFQEALLHCCQCYC